MESKKFLLGTTALLLTFATGRAHADNEPRIWDKPASDQYSYMNHHALADGAGLLDQYGDKLSGEGRWGYVRNCFDETHGEQSIVAWALCGDDLKALDVKALDLSDSSAAWIENWKKKGASFEADAKTDPGVLAILKQAEAAKADWKTFEAANHDAIALYRKLQEGVRTSKSNAPQFDGCWEATQPAFAKAVKATKFSWDNEGDDAVDGRVREVVTTPANYYAVANFGMCAYAAHATGAVLAGAAFRAPGAVFGWRTLLISKLVDPAFKPKFSDRSLSWNTTSDFGSLHFINAKFATPELQFPWPSGTSMKYDSGTIGKLKKDGDDTVVTFKAGMVDGCLNWKETGKIRTWDTAGDPVYERICTKRGKVQEDAPEETTFGTKLTDGFAPGMGIGFVGAFPEEVYNKKANKFVAILGVSVKGSPAETPKKE